MKPVGAVIIVGRLISVSHVAFGSTRVMLTSALGGQAVGYAATLCLKHECMPAELIDESRIKELQQLLAVNGQSIPKVAITEGLQSKENISVNASSSLKFEGFAPADFWRRLDEAIGELLPLDEDIKYEMEFEIAADEVTSLTIELAVSHMPENYTPNVVLESQTLQLIKGLQKVKVKFNKTLPVSSYAFAILRRNPGVSVRMSDQRVSGILSVFNKYNKAVNNYGRQTPPKESGFKEFEFFTPERRPAGQNIAFSLSPALSCFEPDNVLNGYLRPFLGPNAWVADWNDDKPELIVNFDKDQMFNEIKLYFDTDADHPMEPVQWGHPERIVPFCVCNYKVYDDNGNLLADVKDNHQTINTINLKKTVVTNTLRIVFDKKEDCKIPTSLYQVVVNSE